MKPLYIRNIFLIAAAFLSAGCAEAISSGGDAQQSVRGEPTLLVENRSGYQVAVYLDGARIGTATTGRNCILIPRTLGELHLVFATLGSRGFAGPVAFLEQSRHWRVALTPAVTIKYDVIGMVPSRDSCAV